MKNVIEFKNVTKKYKLYKNNKQRLLGVLLNSKKINKKIAVNDVSFEIKKGESVAFLGKNGAR